MSTRAKSIVNAIKGLLEATTPLAGGNIFQSRLRKLQAEYDLAIVVRRGPDVRIGPSTLNKTQRQLSVITEIYARGDIPDDLADPVMEGVVARVLANRELSGLCDDIAVGSVVPDWEARDSDLVVMDLEFIVDYEIGNEEL
jgi:hypothetical protein